MTGDLAEPFAIHDAIVAPGTAAAVAIPVSTQATGLSANLSLLVMNGAFIPAAQLLSRLSFPLQVGYLHATRYRGSTTGSGLAWLHRPATPMRGRRVLLADDILDEGHTLAEVRRWCIEQGATDVRIAALTVKDHDRCVAGLQADYVGLHLPDRYVFGFGMDYHEQGRNLPGIYALKD